jgi:predicted protein tyrosine phosphatase
VTKPPPLRPLKAPATVYSIAGPWQGRLACHDRVVATGLKTKCVPGRKAGIDVIVSLLTPDEVFDFELAQEAQLSQTNGLGFFQLPIMDRGVPSSSDAALDLVEKLDQALAEGKNVGIHCRQSIGRSALIAAAILGRRGIEPEEAFQRIGSARGCAVPETSAQREWVTDFVRELTGAVPQR